MTVEKNDLPTRRTAKCMYARIRTVGIWGGAAAELGIGTSARPGLFEGPSLTAVVTPSSGGGARRVMGVGQEPGGLIGASVNLG